jgi:hypothetical protein
VWSAVVWSAVVWCGVVWCGVVWCGVELVLLRFIIDVPLRLVASTDHRISVPYFCYTLSQVEDEAEGLVRDMATPLDIRGLAIGVSSSIVDRMISIERTSGCMAVPSGHPRTGRAAGMVFVACICDGGRWQAILSSTIESGSKLMTFNDKFNAGFQEYSHELPIMCAALNLGSERTRCLHPYAHAGYVCAQDGKGVYMAQLQ